MLKGTPTASMYDAVDLNIKEQARPWNNTSELTRCFTVPVSGAVESPSRSLIAQFPHDDDIGAPYDSTRMGINGGQRSTGIGVVCEMYPLLPQA